MSKKTQGVPVHAIITAGGSGSRAGFKQNKILEIIDGEPVIKKTLLVFDNAKRVDDIIVVYKDGDLQKLKEILSDIKKPLKFVLGGKTRFESVKNALQVVDDGVVLIHDGARPYLDQKDLSNCIKSVLVDGSAILTAPLVNTIVESDIYGNAISSTRNNLYSATTQRYRCHSRYSQRASSRKPLRIQPDSKWRSWKLERSMVHFRDICPDCCHPVHDFLQRTEGQYKSCIDKRNSK